MDEVYKENIFHEIQKKEQPNPSDTESKEPSVDTNIEELFNLLNGIRESFEAQQEDSFCELCFNFRYHATRITSHFFIEEHITELVQDIQHYFNDVAELPNIVIHGIEHLIAAVSFLSDHSIVPTLKALNFYDFVNGFFNTITFIPAFIDLFYIIGNFITDIYESNEQFDFVILPERIESCLKFQISQYKQQQNEQPSLIHEYFLNKENSEEEISDEEFPNEEFPNEEFQNEGFPNEEISNQEFPNEDITNQAFPNEEITNQEFPEEEDEIMFNFERNKLLKMELQQQKNMFNEDNQYSEDEDNQYSEDEMIQIKTTFFKKSSFKKSLNAKEKEKLQKEQLNKRVNRRIEKNKKKRRKELEIIWRSSSPQKDNDSDIIHTFEDYYLFLEKISCLYPLELLGQYFLIAFNNLFDIVPTMHLWRAITSVYSRSPFFFFEIAFNSSFLNHLETKISLLRRKIIKCIFCFKKL